MAGENYDWEKAAEATGESEKLGLGVHRVKVLKVVNTKKGKPWKSSDGSPVIGVVYHDLSGAEAMSVHTLSKKASWTLAKLLSCVGTKMADLKAQSISPTHFGNVAFAESHLKGKPLYIEITQDGEYTRVEPLKDEDVTEEMKAAVAPAPSSDDPFDKDTPF